jgi:hypothetical protein
MEMLRIRKDTRRRPTRLRRVASRRLRKAALLNVLPYGATASIIRRKISFRFPGQTNMIAGEFTSAGFLDQTRYERPGDANVWTEDGLLSRLFDVVRERYSLL